MNYAPYDTQKQNLQHSKVEKRESNACQKEELGRFNAC
jgi:hypothetical protein